jgi:hypothetical protein
MNGIASFSSVGQVPILRKQQKLFCRTYSVVAMSGVAFDRHDLQIVRHLTFFPGGFLNQNVYSNNPSSPEDLEYSIEWAFAGTCYKLLSLKKRTPG